MADLTLLLTGCGGIAVLALALDNGLPPTLRPWWRARARWVLPSRHQRVGQTPTVACEEMVAGLPPAAARPALSLVEAPERRRASLPFVGRERRRQPDAPAQARRRVGRD